VSIPELLAPAGDIESLTAAVNNGADAVYVGLAEFNARRGAENLSLDELREACSYAHLRGAKVYLTANVLILEDEMHDALRMVDSAWVAGVDAVIIQDLGLLRNVHVSLPDVRVHASTQIGAHDRMTIGVLADLGVSRITLARETSIEEISLLAHSAPVELESFVHGSLCVCHSGQCLMSSLIGGRSANRGLCAQPCRLPYTLLRDDVEVDTEGPYLLSPKDLAGIALLPDLVNTGISALKIEGRMKSAEYVALVVGVYRAALDRLASCPDDFEVSEGEWEVLEEAFNRGFTPGYLSGIDGDRLMSLARPNNRGVAVGRVVRSVERLVSIALTRALDRRDRIEFWTGRGRFTQRVGDLILDGKHVDTAPAGVEVIVRSERSVSRSDRVFRVENASLVAAARRTIGEAADTRKLPIEAHVRVVEGAPLSVCVVGEGTIAEAVGSRSVEHARTKAITVEEIMEHVGRTGGTPYKISSWEVELDPRAGVGYSELHRIRREALKRLDEARLVAYSSRQATVPEPYPVPLRVRKKGRVELVVAVTDVPTAQIALSAGADRVLVAVDAADNDQEMPERVFPLLPRIAHDPEVTVFLDRAQGAESAACGHLGLLTGVVKSGCHTESDWSLNVLNPWSADVVSRLGARLQWLSPELSREQIKHLVPRSSLPVGLIVYGRQELMVTQHCILSSAGTCSGDCGTCGRRRASWTLKDRKGYEFPVYTDASGRSHVLNSRTLDLTHHLTDILEMGVAAVRVDLWGEEGEHVEGLVRSTRGRLEAASAGVPGPGRPLAEPSTGGHFFRGVR